MSGFTFVSAQHGNEPLPTLALASVGQEQVVGNPAALARNVRFLEKDLNASFASPGNTLEEKRAREILDLIPTDTTVVDFHTFMAASPPFAIVVDPAYLPLATKTGLPNVVVMRFNPKQGHALINHRPGISVECGQHQDPQSFRRALKIRQRVLQKDFQPATPPRVFEVYDTIKTPGEYHNFREYQSTRAGEEAFFPVLTGQPESPYYGLKARLISPETLTATKELL